MLRERFYARVIQLDLGLWIWSGAQGDRRISHDPAQSERQRDGDSFPVGHGAPLSPGGKARGAPGRFSLGAPRVVFGETLCRGGRRVLLTTVLLIEEPEGQHDQGDDQPDLEHEEQQRHEEYRRELPKADAEQTNGGELQDRLHDQIHGKGDDAYYARITGRCQRW